MNNNTEYPVFSLVNNYLNKERVLFQDLVEFQNLVIPLSWRLGVYQSHLQSLSIIYMFHQSQGLIADNNICHSNHLKESVSNLESLINKFFKVLTMMSKRIHTLLNSFEFQNDFDAIHQIVINCSNKLNNVVLPGVDELERTTPITHATLATLVTEYDDKGIQVYHWIRDVLEYIMQIDDAKSDSTPLDLAPYELLDQLSAKYDDYTLAGE